MSILTKAQAEAVYSAMCALNNVSGRINAVIGDLRVAETNSSVFVYEFLEGQWEPCERYDNQADFAAAYGLQ